MTFFRVAALVTFAACASPPEAHKTPAGVVQDLDTRMPDMGGVESALALVAPDELGFYPPTKAELENTASPGFWYGAAYAFAPTVRDARATALAALALEESAGSPGTVDIRLMDHEFGGEDVLAESVATFDLVGLLGLGPSDAAKRLARTESLLALADLGAALWQARFEVDQARLAVDVARRRVALYTGLLVEVEADLERIAILERQGRIGSSRAAQARGQVFATDAARGAAEEELVRAHASLARATGLPLQTAELVPPSTLLEEPDPELGPVNPQHPRLRSARLTLASAEARLRTVSARAWPGIRLGPHLGFPSGGADPLNIGGVLALSLPFPSSYAGPLEAAAIARDRSLERYAEAVLSLRTDFEEANKQVAIASSRAKAATDAASATGITWSAARAGFQNGRTELGAWAGALERRRASLTRVLDVSAAAARAALVARNTRGPAMDFSVSARFSSANQGRKSL